MTVEPLDARSEKELRILAEKYSGSEIILVLYGQEAIEALRELFLRVREQAAQLCVDSHDANCGSDFDRCHESDAEAIRRMELIRTMGIRGTA